MIRRLKRICGSQAGDTIIEVSLALTVLALVLGTSTVLASRNTKTLQNAQEQNIAARYAQQQLEYLKTRVAANPTILTNAPAKFCMTSADAEPVNAATSTACNIKNQAATYEQVVTLTPVTGYDQLYTAKVTVQWDTLTTRLDDSGNPQNRGNVQLTYRVYTKLGAKRDPNSTVCGPGLVYVAGACLPAPKVTLAASPNAITTGKSATLSWTSENVTSCTPSGSWGGTVATSGNRTVTPSATSNYTITCGGTSAGSVTASATITVTPPPPPRIPLYSCYQFNLFQASPLPVPQYVKTNHFYTTNEGECDNNGAGTGVREGIIGYVPLNTNSGAIPMYGGFSSIQWDDFYTTSYEEYYNAHVNLGYTGNSRTRFYVYPYNSGCSVPGTVPLNRWYSGSTGDHVYIPNNGNPNTWAPQDGGGTFVWEGQAACIFSGPAPLTD